MKKTMIFVIMCIFVTLITAETVNMSYHFDAPTFETQEGYTKVSVKNTTYLTKPGHPQLPVLPLQILLPPGMKAESVKVTSKKVENLLEDVRIYPSQKLYRIGSNDPFVFDEPDSDIYNSNEIYPENSRTEFSTQYLKGFSVLLTNIYPVRYDPSSGSVLFSSDLNVEIELTSDDESEKAYSRMYKSQLKSYVKTYVDNPDLVDQYPVYLNERTENHKYLIITSYTFYGTTGLQDLYDFKESQGYNPVIKYKTDIISEYPGIDTQEKIRNCIKDYYRNYDTEYVILIGDVGSVPHRGFYGSTGESTDYNIPADYYYSALDSVGTGYGPDFNRDNDDRWGEVNESDFLPEVEIGRLTVDNATELNNAVNKQIKYLSNPVIGDITKALTVGESLNSSPQTWGGDYKDEIVTGGNHNGYLTGGFDNDFTVSTLYERDSYWGETSIRNALNSGVNLVNHLGHSTTNYNMKFYNGSVTDNMLTSNGVSHSYFILFSQGCYSSAFDENDAISEKFTSIANGCAAYIGNSRYGWYAPGSTDGASQYFDRQFFDSFLREGIYTLGGALNDARCDGASQAMSDAGMRWCFNELTISGDPSVFVWTDLPGSLDPIYNASINMDDETLSIFCPGGLSDVVLKDGDETITSVRTDNSGIVDLDLTGGFSEPTTLDIYITTPNNYIHRGTVEVIPPSGPYVSVINTEISDNNDNLISAGETIDIEVELKNIGTDSENMQSIEISCENPNIQIINGTVSNIGTINSNEAVVLSENLRIRTSRDFSNEDQFTLIFTVNGASATWTSQETYTVYKEEIQISGVTIESSDNMIHAGSTEDISVVLENVGGIAAQDINVVLENNEPNITVNTNELQISELQSGNSTSLTFEISTDSETPAGYMAEHYIVCYQNNNVIFSQSFVITVDQSIAGFEEGDFSAFNWSHGGSLNWVIDPNTAYQGGYSMKSGDINDSQTSSVSVTLNILNSGQIQFFKRVSCEEDPDNDYDKLIFYIDGNEVARWDGEIPWSESRFDVESGIRTFQWQYVKDAYTSSGDDCAWIDNIIFPPFTQGHVPEMNVDSRTITIVQTELNQPMTEDVVIYNDGEIPLVGQATCNYAGFELLDNSDNPVDTLNFSIAAGDSASIAVQFTPTSEGEFFGQIDMSTNDPLHSVYYLNIVGTTTIVANDDNDVARYADRVIGNYPNPFNPETKIEFSVKNDNTPVKIKIYNIKGELVKTLENGVFPAGHHSVTWYGKDRRDRSAASGVYFYKTVIGKEQFVNKMILLK